MILAEILIGLTLFGSFVYCALSVLAVLKHLGAKYSATPVSLSPISVLKSLAGTEPSLEANLRSFFEQDYPYFELLFAVRSDSDPAVPLVERLRAEYPSISSRLIITGEPPYANAKVFNLKALTAAAAHEILVMSDSDVRVDLHFLQSISREVSVRAYDLATCPYRAVPAANFWSLLEALGMNTEFWASAFVAKLVEGVRFTVGPTVVARRRVFDSIPWDSLSHFLAEDFVLGSRAAEQGYRVDLSGVVVEHHLSDESAWHNLSHRIRWARSTRCSRPAGYVGQLFTNPIPLAVILIIVKPALWPVVIPTIFLRVLSAYVTASWALSDPLFRRWWVLTPLQDLLSFIFWIAGFTGNRIDWRGRRYKLHRDGTFELVT